MTPPEKIPFDSHRAYQYESVPQLRIDRITPSWFAQSTCTDSDGGIADTMADIMAQSTIPGKTTAYVPVPKQGTLTWKKLTGTDGCKTPTLLLEHSCLRKSAVPGVAPEFSFHYIPCSPDTICGSATDPITDVTAAACLPISPPPLPNCPPTTWIGMGLTTNSMEVYALAAHQGDLFAGGSEGVQRWAPDEETWQMFNLGFAPPLWKNAPLIVDLASFNDHLYSVMLNSGAERLYRLPPMMTTWGVVSEAPLHGCSLYPDGEVLYLGHDEGVHTAGNDVSPWMPVGDPLEATIHTIGKDDTALLAGTSDGEVLRYDALLAAWVPALPPFETNFIHAIQRYGEYLYVGAEWVFSRCWTETGIWDDQSLCEQIEPDTGFPTDLSPLDLRVHNDVLYVATSQGIRRFDAATDSWLPLNAGLALIDGAPLHTFALTTFDGALVVGTMAGVYRWGCAE